MTLNSSVNAKVSNTIRITEQPTVFSDKLINISMISRNGPCVNPSLSLEFEEIDFSDRNEYFQVFDNEDHLIGNCTGSHDGYCGNWITCLSEYELKTGAITKDEAYYITLLQTAFVEASCLLSHPYSMNIQLTVKCSADTLAPTHEPTENPTKSPISQPWNSPVQSISIHTADEQNAKSNFKIGITLWFNEEIYQCRIHPNKKDTEYVCDDESSPPWITISDDDYNCTDYKVMITNTFGDEVIISRIEITLENGIKYGMTGFCVDRNISGDVYDEFDMNDTTCDTNQLHSIYLCADNSGKNGCYPFRQIVYFDIFRPNEVIDNASWSTDIYSGCSMITDTFINITEGVYTNDDYQLAFLEIQYPDDNLNEKGIQIEFNLESEWTAFGRFCVYDDKYFCYNTGYNNYDGFIDFVEFNDTYYFVYSPSDGVIFWDHELRGRKIWNEIAANLSISSFIYESIGDQFIFVNKLSNMFNAQKYCLENYNTSLASIHSEEQNLEAADLCSSFYDVACYIGLNYSNNTGLSWLDQSLVNYNKSYINNSESCATLPNDINTTIFEVNWYDTNCFEAHYFLCNRQDPTNAPTETPTNSPSQAPSMPPTTAPSSAPTVPPTNAPTRVPTESDAYNSYIETIYKIEIDAVEIIQYMANNMSIAMEDMRELIERGYISYQNWKLEYFEFSVKILDINELKIDQIKSTSTLFWNEAEDNGLNLNSTIECAEYICNEIISEFIEADFENIVTKYMNSYFDDKVDDQMTTNANSDYNETASRILFSVESMSNEPKELNPTNDEPPQYVFWALAAITGLIVLVGLFGLIYNKKSQQLSKLPGCNVVDDGKWGSIMVFALQFW